MTIMFSDCPWRNNSYLLVVPLLVVVGPRDNPRSPPHTHIMLGHTYNPTYPTTMTPIRHYNDISDMVGWDPWTQWWLRCYFSTPKSSFSKSTLYILTLGTLGNFQTLLSCVTQIHVPWHGPDHYLHTESV